MSELNMDDVYLIQLSGGTCTLDSSPGENWVERSGGLPNYICRIARAIMRSGKSKSAAIAIAVSRVKKWAAGADDVDADTQAKAAKAVAEWEALKAKNKSGNVVAASRNGQDYLLLTNGVNSYSIEFVRNAFYTEFEDRLYPEEMWSDHIIASTYNNGSAEYFRVPFTADSYSVHFGDIQSVRKEYIPDDTELTDAELRLLAEYTED